jgi:hypothetical protein
VEQQTTRTEDARDTTGTVTTARVSVKRACVRGRNNTKYNGDHIQSTMLRRRYNLTWILQLKLEGRAWNWRRS